MDETDLPRESIRALSILAVDGPAYQERRRPLLPLLPLIEKGLAEVSERTQGKRDIIEEVTITDDGREVWRSMQ